MFVQIAVALSAHKKCDRSEQTIASVLGFLQWDISELTVPLHSSYAPGRIGTRVTSSIECRLQEGSHANEATQVDVVKILPATKTVR